MSDYDREDYGVVSAEARARTLAEINSDELLRRLNQVFAEHSDRTGRSLEWCRVHLVNGVMPYAA